MVAAELTASSRDDASTLPDLLAPLEVPNPAFHGGRGLRPQIGLRSGQRGRYRERRDCDPVRSKYSADPQVSIVQQVVTVTANRSQPWLSPNVFPLCV